MSAKIISFGIQKGGVGKTTSTAITAYLLSEDAKVLAVDFDSQGNLTNFLTRKSIYEFTKRTVMEAIETKNPKEYIYAVSDNLHVLPAEDSLSLLPRYIYQEHKGNKSMVLKEILNLVKNDYDYILIDLPPNLGDHTINGVTASDYAVVLLQSEPFCNDALERYLTFLQSINQSVNPNLRLSGILTSMLDSRAVLDAQILEQAKKDYESLVFESVIKRRSRIKEFTIEGISTKYKPDREALEQYIAFVEELKQRVG